MSQITEQLTAAQKLAEMIVRNSTVDLVRRNTITFRFEESNEAAKAAALHDIARSSAKGE